MIDVKKCFGCRRSQAMFILVGEKYCHFDILHSQEASGAFPCENSKEIEPFLNKERGFYFPNEELEAFFDDQLNWYSNIEELLDIIYEDNPEGLASFWNKGEKGSRTWNKENSEVEEYLLQIIKEKEIEINLDFYPFLLINKQK